MKQFKRTKTVLLNGTDGISSSSPDGVVDDCPRPVSLSVDGGVGGIVVDASGVGDAAIRVLEFVPEKGGARGCSTDFSVIYLHMYHSRISKTHAIMVLLLVPG